MIKIDNFKSVICLNGNLPSADFFKSVAEALIPIIGVDGGAKRLIEMGVKSDFIIGDMDSFDINLKQNLNIIVVEDQNYTDFEKAIVFAKDKDFAPSLILGMNGGEIDHILNNITTFIRYSDEFDMWFYDIPNFGNQKMGRATINLRCNVPEGSTVSIFSFDEGKVVTQGMVWEIKSENFHVMKKSGARNRAKSEIVEISTDGMKLLTIIDANLIQ